MTGLAWGHGRALKGRAAHRAPQWGWASRDRKALVTSAWTDQQEVGLLPGGNREPRKGTFLTGTREEAPDMQYLKKAHLMAAQTCAGCRQHRQRAPAAAGEPERGKPLHLGPARWRAFYPSHLSEAVAKRGPSPAPSRREQGHSLERCVEH